MNQKGALSIMTFIYLIIYTVMFYVLLAVMDPILNNLLFPLLDVVPTFGAIGKLIIYIAIYVMVALGIMAYAIGENNSPPQQQGGNPVYLNR